MRTKKIRQIFQTFSKSTEFREKAAAMYIEQQVAEDMDLGHQVKLADVAYWELHGKAMVVYDVPELQALAGVLEADLKLSPGCLLSPARRAYFVLDIEAVAGDREVTFRLTFDALEHLNTLPALAEVAKGKAFLILTADHKRRRVALAELYQVGAVGINWLPDETGELLGVAGTLGQLGSAMKAAMN